MEINLFDWNVFIAFGILSILFFILSVFAHGYRNSEMCNLLLDSSTLCLMITVFISIFMAFGIKLILILPILQ